MRSTMGDINDINDMNEIMIGVALVCSCDGAKMFLSGGASHSTEELPHQYSYIVRFYFQVFFPYRPRPYDGIGFLNNVIGLLGALGF